MVESGELTEMVRVVSRLARTKEELSDVDDCAKQELHSSKLSSAQFAKNCPCIMRNALK